MTTCTYEFPVIQNGTYCYHSHSGLQEQIGHYCPIVIDPVNTDPVASDREHVIVLSDWTFLHPHQVMGKLKKQGGYFNRQKQTLAGLLGEGDPEEARSEEHTSELQSLMRISYAVFCLKKKKKHKNNSAIKKKHNKKTHDH